MDGKQVRVVRLGPLTPREAEALLWIAEGKTAWEAGTILGVSQSTLNAHASSAAEKLHATNRAHLVTRAFVYGILKPIARLVLVAALFRAEFDAVNDKMLRTRPSRRREDEQPALVVYSQTA